MSYWSYKFYVIMLVILVLPVAAWAYHVPGHDSIVTCGLNGPDCGLCDFMALGQSILNFTLKIIVPFVAIIFVIYGGYLYLTAGASPGNVEKAKKTLWHTLLGIVITVAAYSATSLLIGFVAKGGSGYDFGFKGGVFSLQCVSSSPAIDLSRNYKGGVISFEMSDPENGSQKIDLPNTPFSSINNIAIGDADVVSVKTEVREGLHMVSQDKNLIDNFIGLSVVSGKRTVEKQKSEVAKNCPVGATSSKQCSPETCIPKDAQGSNCPHVAGAAVDVHGVALGADGKPLSQCPNTSPCQQKVVEAMRRAGFCVLASEPWHFEKPKISPSCN